MHDFEDGRLTRVTIIDHNDFARNELIDFMSRLGRSSYVYRKITHGALIYVPLTNGGNITDDTATLAAYKALVETLGSSIIAKAGIVGDDEVYTGSDLTIIINWIIAGNYAFGRPPLPDDASSFVLFDGEESLFADEISGGDLLVFDLPDETRGAVVYVDWPDFTIEGTLFSTNKVSGDVILDNEDILGYANHIWIPAGQSGVPAALEEVPLQIDTYSGKLRFRSWDADVFFEASFTNADSINIYRLHTADIAGKISTIGLKCMWDHFRSSHYRHSDKFRMTGFVEAHPRSNA